MSITLSAVFTYYLSQCSVLRRWISSVGLQFGIMRNKYLLKFPLPRVCMEIMINIVALIAIF